MKYKKTILIIILAIIILPTFAQEKEKKEVSLDYLSGTIELKTMHLWRGQEVSDEITTTTDIHLKSKDGSFKFGLWGGVGVNGNYKEFNYYTSYSKSGFTVALWDIYNFSPKATYNNTQAFNYKAKETGHFIDASVAYRLQGNFPLKLYLATILFGRDRGVMNEKNRYSTYIELEYPVISKKGISLDAGIGGAFVLDKGKGLDGKSSKATFYGDTAGIVDIHLRLSKDIYIGGYKLPVAVMPVWNPQSNYMNMQLAVTLISL